jgi:hypothetical protein
MNNDFNKFFKRAAILIPPFIILYGPFAYVLLRTGEVTSLNHIIDKQISNQKPYLVGFAYTEFKEYYKLHFTLKKDPSVLVLGSSRVMEIREEFFRPCFTFYNAGGSIDHIVNLNEFLDRLPVKSNLRVIYLGLDPWFFNANYDNMSSATSQKKQYDHYSNFNMLFRGSTLFHILVDIRKGKIRLAQINQSGNCTRVGLSAVMNSTGYRNDGSYNYGYLINHFDNSQINHDYKFNNTLQRIRNGNMRFEYCSNVNIKAISELNIFLAACKKRSILVVAYLPPFANSIYKKLQEKGADYAYLASLDTELKSAFSKCDFPFFNFMSIEGLGATDSEFIDGFHGSEKADLRILLEIARQNSLANQYVDSNSLAVMLKNSAGNLMVVH